MAASSSQAPLARLCSRQGCKREAVSTLTYVYSDSTAVVGPLSVHNEPHAYDLCGQHAQRLTAPRGWEILRVEIPETRDPEPAAGHATAVPLPITRAVSTPEPDHGSAPDAADAAPSVESVQSTESADDLGTGPLAEVRPLKVSTAPECPVQTGAHAPAPAAESPSPSAHTAHEFSGEDLEDEEHSLVNEIFASEHAESDPVTADQPKAMRIPHLRRRSKRG